MRFYKIAEVVGGTIRLEGDADFRPMSADWRTHCYKGKKHKDPGYLTDDGTPGEWGTLGWMSTQDYDELPDAPAFPDGSGVDESRNPEKDGLGEPPATETSYGASEDTKLVDPTPAPTGDSPDSSQPQPDAPALWPPANPDESQR